jgi:hypothetical protein
MTHSAGFSTKSSCAALLCVCALLLAWAAPAIMLAGDVPEYLQRGQGRQASEPADAPAEMEDASDDPVAFVASSQPGHLPVTYTLQTDPLLDRAWSPTALVRPPNPLNSI